MSDNTHQKTSRISYKADRWPFFKDFVRGKKSAPRAAARDEMGLALSALYETSKALKEEKRDPRICSPYDVARDRARKALEIWQVVNG